MSIQDLKDRATIIKTETVDENNSADRVGDLMVDIIDSVISNTEDQEIDGVKTFSLSPVVPVPTKPSEAVNLKTLDEWKIKETSFPESVFKTIPSANLFNKNSALIDIYVQNGLEHETTGYWASDFIPVASESHYISNQTFTFVDFFDINKIHISGISLGNQSTITTPSNCYFLRLSEVESVSPKTTFQLELGNIITVYKDYSGIQAQFSSKEDVFIEVQFPNIFNKETILQNHYVNEGNLSFASGYWTSDYIPVIPLATYIANHSFTFISFFTESKIFISRIALVGQTLIEPPYNAQYVMISELESASSSEIFQLELGIVSTDYKPFGNYISKFNDIKLESYTLAKEGVKSYTQLGRLNPSYASAFVSTDGIATNLHSETTQKGRIKEISFFARTTGTAHFVIGLRDQWGKAIFSEQFSIAVSSIGNQTHQVDYSIESGNQLFYLLTNPQIIGYGVNTPASENLLTYNDTDRFGVMFDFAGSSGGYLNMSYKVEYATENLDELYYRLNSINEKIITQDNDIASLKSTTYITDKITGEKFKLLVTNGNLSLKSTLYKKAVAFGNSITLHPVTSFWWGYWGMAATVRENDWVHVFQSKLRENYVSATVTAKNIADWETSPSIFNYSSLDSLLETDIDLVVLKVSENVTDLVNFQVNYTALINYIISKVPTAEIIAGGDCFGSSAKDAIMKAACDLKGIPFVSNSAIHYGSIYMSSLDTEVYGDDNQWHTISDGGITAPGVANHPGDLGHQLIADNFYSLL